MEGFLKLSTQVTITVLMIDSSDHVTGKTGLSAGLTIYASKAGVSPATITPTVAELDSTNVKGVYSLVLTTTHTNTLGELQLHITGSGADPTDVKWQVSTYLPGEAATLQSAQKVDVDTIKTNPVVNGGTITFPTNATVASTTNITAGTIATVTTVTGLTASNLDATISSRMATYTQPTGFLAATFPSGTIANTTNLTAGIITTVSGNVTGSVGSISGVSFPSNFSALSISAAGKINEVVLVDTLTVYTGNTVQTGDAYAKVSGLTFTVAGQVDSNIHGVNNITVTGSGTAGVPWGP